MVLKGTDEIEEFLKGMEEDLKGFVEETRRARYPLELLILEGMDSGYQEEAGYVVGLLVKYSESHPGTYPRQKMKEFAEFQGVPYEEVKRLLRYIGLAVVD
jgi:hypothetical protein